MPGAISSAHLGSKVVPVGMFEDAVEDGVAEGGIADDIVPVLDEDLAGQ